MAELDFALNINERTVGGAGAARTAGPNLAKAVVGLRRAIHFLSEDPAAIRCIGPTSTAADEPAVASAPDGELYVSCPRGPHPRGRRGRLRCHLVHRAAPARTRRRSGGSGTASTSAGRLDRHQQGGASRIRGRRGLHGARGEGDRVLAPVEPRSRPALPRDRSSAPSSHAAVARDSRAGQLGGGVTPRAQARAARRGKSARAISRLERGAVPARHLRPEGGFVESGRAIARLVAEAQRVGVELREGVAFGRLLEQRTGIVSATGETIAADQVVLALGAWTPHALPWLATELRSTGHPVFHLAPPDRGLFEPDPRLRR